MEDSRVLSGKDGSHREGKELCTYCYYSNEVSQLPIPRKAAEHV